MITPRRTRLVRVPDLHAFQRAILGAACLPDLRDVRSTAVLVSTQAAASELRHTLENMVLLEGNRTAARAAIWPDILTRDGWYERMHHACGTGKRQLSAIEREVLMARAAREAVAGGHRPPFRVRPALVAEMVAFFDTMCRLGRTLDAFERLLVEELEPRVGIDRGAARLLAQTRFLVAAFHGYRGLVASSGAEDEHLLRERLLLADGPPAFRRVVVTVGDRPCGPGGLWPVDIDLLARLPHLEQIDIIATEAVLAAGFHERLHDALPGLEEIDGGVVSSLPTMVTPAGADTKWWTSRDREEEIGTIARRIKRARANGDPVADVVGAELARPLDRVAPPLDRVAIVCKRPLPYVYLAHAHLRAAGIPFQAFDDLPLAAEPFAAGIDLVFRFVESGFARPAAVALLASPHFSFRDDEGEIPRGATRALDGGLRDAGFAGGIEALERTLETWRQPEATRSQRAAARAGGAAANAAREIESLTRRQPPSVHFGILRAFCEAHAPRSDEDAPAAERNARARAAVLDALSQFVAAHRAHDDPPADFEETASRLRQWMEAQTFSPRTGRDGVHLVDAEAARYGDFDEVHLVGLIDREWPDKSGRTIFYPLTLLNQLGWPPERLRLASARAAFRELIRLAAQRVSVSTFLLEDDAIVEPSPFLDEVERSGLAVCTDDAAARLRILPEDALSLDPVRADVLGPEAQAWAELRQGRGDFAAPRFHGAVGPIVVRTHAVRRVEAYLECPFKYFAEAVLGLTDDTDDDPAEGPRAQGKFLHDVLAAFFEKWQACGGGAITAANLPAARAAFAEQFEARAAHLAPADRALWRARLLGSAARAGIADIVLRAEAERPDPVRHRLLEHRFDGACVLQGETAREVHLRGIADRIDLLEDDRLRLIDYKLGRAPDVHRAVQLCIYAAQAVRHFASLGREVTLGDAAYLAFGERDPYVTLARGQSLDRAVADGQARALDAIDRIEHGDMPARPAEAFQCGYCAYASLCRKEYVDGQ